MEKNNIYQDISARTGGEIYLGVVGPVRSGKSTFIKRFMELMVLPEIADEHERQRTMDEMPQSGTGKTIMTTEPKFIPKEAVELPMEDMKVKVRLIDCVGFMVMGAGGHLENGQERLVKTPWFDYEVPFTKAAEYGTRKVIRDHSTIGILVTTDGSFGEIPRDSYVEAEKRTVEELQAIGKPFLVLLNSDRPYSKATQNLAENLTKEYRTTVMPVNCDQLRQEDILEIMKNVLLEFPLSSVGFYLPKWVETLRDDHWMKKSILDLMKEYLADKEKMKDIYQKSIPQNEYMESGKVEKIHMDTGEVEVRIQIRDSYYYEILSDLTGISIKNEYHLIRLMKELAGKKKEFEEVSQALTDRQGERLRRDETGALGDHAFRAGGREARQQVWGEDSRGGAVHSFDPRQPDHGNRSDCGDTATGRRSHYIYPGAGRRGPERNLECQHFRQDAGAAGGRRHLRKGDEDQ